MSSLAETNENSVQAILEQAVAYAKTQGADAVEVAANNDKGFSISARLGDVETVEHHNQRSLGITVYRGQAKGSATTNDIKPASIQQTVDAALNIAGHTAEDKFSGLADAELMAYDYPQLDLDHAWQITPEQALELAIQCENSGRDDKRIVNSEGATVNSIRTQISYANSHGFVGDYFGTRHSVSCAVVAGDDKGMQRDYWYSVTRDAKQLEEVDSIGRTARERTVRRLSGRSIKTCTVPVLFEPSVARTIFGHFFSAISGSALYRQASFLVDSLEKQIFPDWISIEENPHIAGGLGSAPFDNEGVRTQKREVVSDGILQGYVLSSYSARKLGLQTTANAGGIHNIQIKNSGLSQQELLKNMGTGVLITELIGHGVNTVTGDYSRGAAGFWIENGEIQYPVEEITVAGNLADMFMNISAIGNDTDLHGNIQCGSILIDHLTIAGS